EQAALIGEYKNRIKSKIRRYVLIPPSVKGNPQAVFDVVLIPGGQVLSATLVQSSGYPAYDDAVQRAILKAQPLPLPPDPSLFSNFRELRLEFRPQE
ncbi:MAG: cell envelope integrity protein TolA, partial [Burkholderiales bacterium]